jgi:hypothetical protein
VTAGSCTPWGSETGEFCVNAHDTDIFATCPVGDKAVGGGYLSTATGSNQDGLFIYDNNPTYVDPTNPAAGADGWHVRAAYYGGDPPQTKTVTAYALCLSTS